MTRPSSLQLLLRTSGVQKEQAVELTAEQHKKLELGSKEVIDDKVFISAATVQTVVWILLWALITKVALPQQL